VNPRRNTPHWAIVAGGAVGIVAINSDQLLSFSGRSLTATLVTMSVFGAIVMYITSMASLFQLRRTEPMLERPFGAPLYPIFPAIALGTAVICLIAMIYYNFMIFGFFMIMFTIAWLFHHFKYDRVRSEEADPMKGHADSW
jgi:ethanolamine permease